MEPVQSSTGDTLQAPRPDTQLAPLWTRDDLQRAPECVRQTTWLQAWSHITLICLLPFLSVKKHFLLLQQRCQTQPEPPNPLRRQTPRSHAVFQCQIKGHLRKKGKKKLNKKSSSMETAVFGWTLVPTIHRTHFLWLCASGKTSEVSIFISGRTYLHTLCCCSYL